MKPTAVIPARGGSKRLPSKNILPFMGRPLIYWPIQAALESQVFERVAVSTEDEEIAAIARDAGAEVILRPAGLAADNSTVVQVCLHALDALGDVRDLCCIYATAALLEPADLIKSHAIYAQEGYDSVMGVAEYDLSPFQALQQVDGKWRLRWPEFRSIQSQHYPELVCSAGMLYWIQADALRRERSFYTDNMGVFKFPRTRLCDINTMEDFQAAEDRARKLPMFQR